MAAFWYKLVKNGIKSIEQVPIKWREEVRMMLEEDDE